MTQPARPGDAEWRGWTAGQLGVSAALTAALGWGLVEFAKMQPNMTLEPWQRIGAWALLGGGLAAFAVRTAALWLRLTGPPRRR